MEDESWRRNHGGEILEEKSWRKFMEERRIIEEESCRGNHGG